MTDYVCVFCGSSEGSRPLYKESATQLGQVIARRGFGLVYGGASIGLMGAVADAVLAEGGPVVGVIPESLAAVEIAHQGLSELIVVRSMHERKAKMEALSSYFVSMPGGFGTLDETFEILTWAQLGIHRKPLGLLNVDHYYDHLLQFNQHQVEEKFVKPVHRDMLIASDNPETLLEKLLTAELPDAQKWLLAEP